MHNALTIQSTCDSWKYQQILINVETQLTQPKGSFWPLDIFANISQTTAICIYVCILVLSTCQPPPPPPRRAGYKQLALDGEEIQALDKRWGWKQGLAERWHVSLFQIFEAKHENDLDLAVAVFRTGIHIDKDEENRMIVSERNIPITEE